MTVFDLGRMRHLDLLALWHQRNPSSHLHAQLEIGHLSKDEFAAMLAP